MTKKRKDGRYQKSITITRKGEIIKKYFYGKTINELNQKVINYKEKEEAGKLFEIVAEEWKNVHFPTIAISTAMGYEASFKRAKARYSGISVKTITPQEVKNYIYAFAKTGMAKKTVATLRLVLNMIFSYAVIQGYITLNPVTEVHVPKNLPRARRKIPEDKEIEVVKSSTDKTFGLFFYLVLFTGLRRGEALALEYEDIDFNRNMIIVKKSISYKGNKPIIKSPKTESSIREVLLLDCLKEKISNSCTGLIFRNINDTYLTYSQYCSLVRKFQRETGLIITAHQLRHAFATILYEAGVQDKDAQELLGHSHISTTKDIYTHISKRQKHKTAVLLNEFINDSFLTAK